MSESTTEHYLKLSEAVVTDILLTPQWSSEITNTKRKNLIILRSALILLLNVSIVSISNDRLKPALFILENMLQRMSTSTQLHYHFPHFFTGTNNLTQKPMSWVSP